MSRAPLESETSKDVKRRHDDIWRTWAFSPAGLAHPNGIIGKDRGRLTSWISPMKIPVVGLPPMGSDRHDKGYTVSGLM
jgi:hypothetical protein